MRKIIFFSILAFLLLFISNVLATSTQQSNKIFLNPFYKESMAKNLNYTFNVTVNPPDKIASVTSAIISFNLYVTSSPQTFNFYANGKPCNNPTWTGTSSGFATASFDCSNVITKSGTYTFTISSIKDTGSATEWLDLTYMNNPFSLFSSGTEYLPNDNASVFVRVLDANSKPINLASCNSTIYYPNKTVFLNQQSLTLLEKGIYYNDFIVPNVLGNYIVSFDCIIPANVFNQNQTLAIKNLQTNGYTGSFPFDNSNNLTINFAFIDINIKESGGEVFNLYFNGNKIFTSSGAFDGTKTINLTAQNFTLSEYQSFAIEQVSGSPEIRWTRLFVNYSSLEPQQLVRGQNEIHVESGFSQINQSLGISENNIINAIIQENQSIHTNLNQLSNNMNSNFTSINNTIKNESSTIQSQILNIPSNVWSFASRTLTAFSFNVNITQQALDNIWNYPTRTLTDFVVNQTTLNITVLNQTVNVTTQNVTVENVTPTFVLNNTYLNLTVENQTVNVTTQEVSVQNVSIYPQYLNITNTTVEVINQTINVTTQNVTVLNQTVNVTTVQENNTEVLNAIQNLNDNINSNFTSLNNSIVATYNLMNFWGNILEAKMDNLQNMLVNITVGNVTVTANVDYDEIAFTVLQYFKAAKTQGII